MIDARNRDMMKMCYVKARKGSATSDIHAFLG